MSHGKIWGFENWKTEHPVSETIITDPTPFSFSIQAIVSKTLNESLFVGICPWKAFHIFTLHENILGPNQKIIEKLFNLWSMWI